MFRLGGSFLFSLILHLTVLCWPGWPKQEINLSPVPAVGARISVQLLSVPEQQAVSVAQVPLENIPTTADAEITRRGEGANDHPATKDIYDLDEVDVRPWIKTRIRPEYPPLLPPGISDTTVLSFIVDEDGQVRDLEVARPAADPLFDLFAIRAFSTARYTPALIGQRPVKVKMSVAITFNVPAEP
jgi:TonB family protein